MKWVIYTIFLLPLGNSTYIHTNRVLITILAVNNLKSKGNTNQTLFTSSKNNKSIAILSRKLPRLGPKYPSGASTVAFNQPVIA